MTPGTYNLDLYRGDSYAWQIRLWDDEAQTDPTDLTGAVAAAEIRDKSAGLKIVALGCTITAPNIIDVVMTPDDWADCPAAGVWDLQITWPGDIVRTVLAGKVKTIADVTDSTAAPTVSSTTPRLRSAS